MLPKRKATWALLIFSVLMLIWLIAGIAGNSGNATNCGSLSQADCNTAAGIGTGIGVSILILIWFLGFVVLGIIALLTRPSKRTCPACGNDVKKGLRACNKCGFNFAAPYGASGPVAPPPPAPPQA